MEGLYASRNRVTNYMSNSEAKNFKVGIGRSELTADVEDIIDHPRSDAQKKKIHS